MATQCCPQLRELRTFCNLPILLPTISLYSPDRRVNRARKNEQQPWNFLCFLKIKNSVSLHFFSKFRRTFVMNFGYELACPTVYFLVQAVDGVQFFANKSCFFNFPVTGMFRNCSPPSFIRKIWTSEVSQLDELGVRRV